MSAHEVENLITAILLIGGPVSLIAGMAVVVIKGDR